ncbi:BLUF domain-containing protein [Rhodobacteraceae bacterium RKSG542]|uniref:BLUF domain-containing protein n=1 Tax=Pseudovibrio flavus TaxID=2529854 RepID=UPI0012BD51DC|nr:BLUF domain-containing protein [Pseudovibrio flavus]MTI16972.1 BLUF domain-containing protein [Pseudovibrio flavus]
MEINQLSYRSRIHWPALRGDLDEEVEKTLRRSRRINQRAGVTGALLLTDTHIFQLLEGPSDAVLSTLDCAMSDKRHTDICILAKHRAPYRLFHTSWMHFCDLRDEPEKRYPRFVADLAHYPTHMSGEEFYEVLMLLSANMEQSRITTRIALM